MVRTKKIVQIRGISSDRLLALENLPRQGAAAAYLAGSAMDGLGNAWSDIDFYVIGECAPVGRFVLDQPNHRVSIHYFHHQRVDFEFWRPDSIEDLAAKLDTFVDDQLADEPPLSAAEQLFIHRLLHNIPCFGDIDSWARRFDPQKLARLQLYGCVRQTDYLHEDICGMLESADYGSAAVLCRTLLDSALGAYLHANGNTVPTAKWRLRLAERMLLETDTLNKWWNLQFASLPDRSDHESLRNYVINCVRCSERLVCAAQG